MSQILSLSKNIDVSCHLMCMYAQDLATRTKSMTESTNHYVTHMYHHVTDMNWCAMSYIRWMHLSWRMCQIIENLCRKYMNVLCHKHMDDCLSHMYTLPMRHENTSRWTSRVTSLVSLIHVCIWYIWTHTHWDMYILFLYTRT